jgi:hypothetical protein
MSKRIATILAPKDLGASGTETIDINMKEAISRITMWWRCTVATASVMLDAVTACLPKIELVDGSEVLASVSGAELQAINFYDRGILPHHKISLTAGEYFEVELGLDFGRYLWDPQFAFLPTRFINPQLKVTWNEDACNTDVSENQFSVKAYADDAAGIGAGGMLINREIKQYTEAASTHTYTELPVDRPIRKLFIRGYSTSRGPVSQYQNIKLSIDNDKIVPLDIAMADYDVLLSELYPRIVERYTLDGAVTAKTLYASVSDDQQINIEYDDTAFVTESTKFSVATWTGAMCALSASVDIKALNCHVSGRYPANTFPINFGNPDEPNTWLDMGGKGSLLLDLTSSSSATSSDTTYLVVQQLRR